MSHQCYFCHNRTAERSINRFGLKDKDANTLIEATMALYQGDNKPLSNPEKARILHGKIEEIVGKGDLYVAEKEEANNTLLNLYPTLKQKVDQSLHPLKSALKLAVAGNLIDFGPGHTFNIESHVEKLANENLAIDDSKRLFEAIAKAKKVLYLGDNAGEIVLDKLFIETINSKNITYVVRGSHTINDATLKDATDIKMDDVATVISNGDNSPSTLLYRVSDEVRELFNSADVIISKGMGNYEGLMNEKHEGLYFLLMAKCNPVAEKLGVKNKDIVVKKCI